MDRPQKRRRVNTRRGLKRKLEEDFSDEEPDRQIAVVNICRELRRCVGVLESRFSSSVADRFAAMEAAKFIAGVSNTDEFVPLLLECGAVPALVKHLQAPPPEKEGENSPIPYEHKVEKECAHALGQIALEPECQQLIVDAGALPHLVDLLKRHNKGCESTAVDDVTEKAVCAITNIANENSNIKKLFRIEGGIPPLVELLKFFDTMVQIKSACALRTLAFRDEKIKKQIVECNALPSLMLMLRSEDPDMAFEAVGVIGNLVHSSPNIKKVVLLSGALQPIIELLSSCCTESQREAALLLGQFAAPDSDCKAHIVQRGALKPLIELLSSPDSLVREMSAFALGRLAQDPHNQAGIAHNGGIMPLLELLESNNSSLQHNAAFSLYGLAENEDNIATLIKTGGVQKLQDGEFPARQTKECVAKTFKRLEDKISEPVLNHLLYLMRSAEKDVQRRVALALAYLCNSGDLGVIFIDNKGLEVLLGLLESTSLKDKKGGSAALHTLFIKAASLYHVDAAPPSPTPQVYLGEAYVNSPTQSDITFSVEGKKFYAHRICLLASSDAFRVMFGGGYRERDAKVVEIPNITWDVFELMMRFIYTGSVDVNLDIAPDLLRAADQYLLDSLKCLCEHAIGQDICVDNVSLMFELSEAYNAMSLRQACILFVLDQFEKLKTKPWYPELMKRILPEIRRSFTSKTLRKPAPPRSMRKAGVDA